MKKLLSVYKPQGLNPLDAIKQLRQNFPEYKDEKIGFAGRLDPLAHGVLLLMIGEETTKQKDTYLNLPKAYEFEVVFGITTDTYDALGVVNSHPELVSGSPEMLNQVQHDIKLFINSKLGKHTQPYPPFSSKAVNGKPLFWWAKQNKLSEIEMPQKEIEIFDFTLIETNSITAEKLKEEIFKQIALIQGDFRQEEIKEKWNSFFSNDKMKSFRTARFHISCSSGTYVRSLANEMGAITLDILRTKVGDFDLKSCLKLL